MLTENQPTLPTYASLKAEGGAFFDEIEAAKADGKIALEEVLGIIVAGVQWLAAIAVPMAGVDRVQRREWVRDIIKDAYFADFNLDIPYVPEFLEKPFETAILNMSVRVYDLIDPDEEE